MVLFDCSQFIYYKPNTNLIKNNILYSFVNEGFKLIEINQMTKNKQDFVSLFYEKNCKVIELEDKNFLGEFEDWKFEDKNNPPIKIKKFIDIIKNIINYVSYFKIIIVRYLYDNKYNDFDFRVININDLAANLYSLSIFGNGGNILSIEIRK